MGESVDTFEKPPLKKETMHDTNWPIHLEGLGVHFAVILPGRVATSADC